MGREKKILLGLLGLLVGVFVGALSLKLLVPRPPAGAGPDIRCEVASTTTQELVEPPAPSPGGLDFAAAPPLVPDAPATASQPGTGETAAFTAAPDASRDPSSRFGGPVAPVSLEPEAPRADAGDVTPASWDGPDQLATPSVAEAEPGIVRSGSRFSTAPSAPSAGPPGPDTRSAEPVAPNPAAAASPPTRDPFVTPAAATLAFADGYVVQAGDSWWAVAERAYGDGRLYRALFAWNRARDPQVSLAPGTRLDVPPLDRLAAAWPRLVPRFGPR